MLLIYFSTSFIQSFILISLFSSILLDLGFTTFFWEAVNTLSENDQKIRNAIKRSKGRSGRMGEDDYYGGDDGHDDGPPGNGGGRMGPGHGRGGGKSGGNSKSDGNRKAGGNTKGRGNTKTESKISGSNSIKSSMKKKER